MIIDYAQRDHLRVGRFLIARCRSDYTAPLIDGATTVLRQADETAALVVVDRARDLVEHLTASDVIDPDELHHEGMLLRSVVGIFDASLDVHHFGGLAFAHIGVAVGWLDRRAPNPARWRPRFMLAQVRWVLAGRPPNVYLHSSGQLRPKSTIGGERAVEFTERTTLDLSGLPTLSDLVAQRRASEAHEPTPMGDGAQ